ncbi:MAG: SLBB domain-containing protein [Bacteroidales bacterium]|nr:SLBB domain-containing protein [Bacteroidales bacterium]
MKKLSLLLLVMCLVSGVSYAQMSDEAVVSYIATSLSEGKSQAQIASELLSKGVTEAQQRRLMKKYRSGKVDISEFKAKAKTIDEVYSTKETNVEADKARVQAEKPVPFIIKDKSGIYGHDMFSGAELTFEPNENAATPEGYVLGPGDELLIEVWGDNEVSIKSKISPEGKLIIPQVGALNLSGLNIAQATSKIRSAMGRRYSGILSNSSSMSVTISEVRTVQVNVIGEVVRPGTYRLSAFTTVFNALYHAGGVTPVGSLRDVKVIRGGKQIASVDVYEFLFSGNTTQNVSLRDGDVLMIPAYSGLVTVNGGVKRPMIYETREGDSVRDMLAYAGGFASGAYDGEVVVARMGAQKNRMYTVPASEFDSFALADGDTLTVNVNADKTLYDNIVEIRGAVVRPGKYAVGGDIATVRQLIEHAGGLLDDAFLSRAQILREKKDRSLEIMAIPVKAIIDGAAEDVTLRGNDVLVIANANEINKKGDLTITGFVKNPGDYQYAANMTIEDLVLMAGGLADGASESRVDVSRRIVDPKSTEAADTLSSLYTFALKDGLLTGDGEKFELMPFDVVSVRKSPSYVAQKLVTVSGEITFPGQYTLISNEERVSDLIKRAGGPTPNAYVGGGLIRRKINQYERDVHSTMAKIAKLNNQKDTLERDKFTISEIYNVGVDMDKAISHPGTDYDLVLRDGDELIIPEVTRTVRIQGEVLYPNTIHFIEGKSVNYYIKSAGGYSSDAKKSKVYVVYQNGTVAVGRMAPIKPGCEIIVPSKPERRKLSPGEWLGIGTSAASLAAMITTIIKLL